MYEAVRGRARSGPGVEHRAASSRGHAPLQLTAAMVRGRTRTQINQSATVSMMQARSAEVRRPNRVPNRSDAERQGSSVRVQVGNSSMWPVHRSHGSPSSQIW